MKRCSLWLICLLVCATALSAANSNWSKLEFKQIVGAETGVTSLAKKLILRSDGSAVAAADIFGVVSWVDAKGITLERWQLSQPVLTMAFQKNILLVVGGKIGESFVLYRLEIGHKPDPVLTQRETRGVNVAMTQRSCRIGHNTQQWLAKPLQPLRIRP